MLDVLDSEWWAVALRGILAIVFGILALVFPGTTLVSLTMLFGADAFVDGVFTLVSAFGTADRKPAGMYSTEFIGIAVGLATFFSWHCCPGPGLSHRHVGDPDRNL